ncbi:MAG: DUF2924 domain-containing protein [Planctomycetota bacterium]
MTQLDLPCERARLEGMTVGQLAQVYEEIVGEPARSRHKQYLIRRILWRVHARAEGDLSERARRRAAELADDAEVRVIPPRQPMTTTSVALPAAKGETADALADRRLPVAGNLAVRQYKGREIRVIVLADGFEYQGQRFRSLSAIAKLVTGSHVNGFRFFRLETGGLRLKGRKEVKT